MATGSRGPLAIVLLSLLIAAFASSRIRALLLGNATTATAFVLTGLGVAYLVVNSAGQLGTITSSNCELLASAEYRPVLFRAAADSLVHQPFG